MVEEKVLTIVPQSMRIFFLMEAHDHAGHQGVEQTLARLMEMLTRWVWLRMYYKHCFKCQTANA